MDIDADERFSLLEIAQAWDCPLSYGADIVPHMHPRHPAGNTSDAVSVRAAEDVFEGLIRLDPQPLVASIIESVELDELLYPPELLQVPEFVLRRKLSEAGVDASGIGDRSALLDAIATNLSALQQNYQNYLEQDDALIDDGESSPGPPAPLAPVSASAAASASSSSSSAPAAPAPGSSPWLLLESVKHKYEAPIEVANASAGKPQDARGVDFKFSVRQPGLPSTSGAVRPADAPLVLHGCLIVQTDASLDGIDAQHDIWPQLEQMAPADLAYCWDATRRDRYFNYVADEAGRPWGLAGHETNMRTDHPASLPPRPDDPEIGSLLSKSQGSWTHSEGYTVCLRAYPPAVVSGAMQRIGSGNLFGGRMFRALFYAEDRVAHPEVICVSEPFAVRARATIDNTRKKAKEAAMALGWEIGTEEHRAYVQQQLMPTSAHALSGSMPLGPKVPHAAPSARKRPLEKSGEQKATEALAAAEKAVDKARGTLTTFQQRADLKRIEAHAAERAAAADPNNKALRKRQETTHEAERLADAALTEQRQRMSEKAGEAMLARERLAAINGDHDAVSSMNVLVDACGLLEHVELVGDDEQDEPESVHVGGTEEEGNEVEHVEAEMVSDDEKDKPES